MEISEFKEKLNKLDGNTYVVEEEVHLTGGVYEADLAHDNVNLGTLAVWTGPKLTGTRIQSYVVSTPSLTPWKRVIRVYADVPVVYISYETDGDTVEAEDINRVQGAVTETQTALNTEAARAKKAEGVLTEDLSDEIYRSKAAEKKLGEDLEKEEKRAAAAEKSNADAIAAGTARAKADEKANAEAITEEVNRAKSKETELQGNIDSHTSAVAGEIQSLKSADVTLDTKKADISYVNTELGKRYTKEQVYTREEVLQKIKDLIGTAPETLDTFKEIADALGNDPNFAGTIMNALAGKVDKVSGKGLSTNDYSASEKAIVADVNARKHDHSNKAIIDKLTQALLDNWSAAYTHISDAVKHITAAERTNWMDAYNKRHEHGNKAILDGITQVLIDKWNSALTALPSHTHAKAQITDMPTKLSQFTNDPGYITQKDVDTSQNHAHANKSILDKLTQTLLDNWNGAFSHVSDGVKHITTAERTAWSSGISTTALTNGSLDDKKTPGLYFAGGGNIVTGKPDKVDAFGLTIYKTAVGFVTQELTEGSTSPGKKYIRQNNGTVWSEWVPLPTFTGVPVSGQVLIADGIIGGQKTSGLTIATSVPSGAKFTDTVYTHPNSGATAGTYRSVTVNTQGHVTGGTNPTTLAGYGITDAAASSHNHDATYLKKGAVKWSDLKGV